MNTHPCWFWSVDDFKHNSLTEKHHQAFHTHTVDKFAGSVAHLTVELLPCFYFGEDNKTITNFFFF